MRLVCQHCWLEYYQVWYHSDRRKDSTEMKMLLRSDIGIQQILRLLNLFGWSAGIKFYQIEWMVDIPCKSNNLPWNKQLVTYSGWIINQLFILPTKAIYLNNVLLSCALNLVHVEQGPLIFLLLCSNFKGSCQSKITFG